MNLKAYKERTKGLSSFEAARVLNEMLASEQAEYSERRQAKVEELISHPDEGALPGDYLPLDQNVYVESVRAASSDTDFLMAQNSIVAYKAQIAKLNRLISLYEAKLDESLDATLSGIENSVDGLASANELVYSYSKDWFKRAVMTINAKCQIAAAILSATKKYPSLHSQFLKRLAAMDVDAIAEVALVD